MHCLTSMSSRWARLCRSASWAVAVCPLCWDPEEPLAPVEWLEWLDEKSSSSTALRFASCTTDSGNWASSATWIPKLWSHTPSTTLYKRVISRPPPELFLLPKVEVPWLVSFSSETPPTCAETCRLPTKGAVSPRAVSSWKWVANRQKLLILVTMCLQEIPHRVKGRNERMKFCVWVSVREGERESWFWKFGLMVGCGRRQNEMVFPWAKCPLIRYTRREERQLESGPHVIERPK